MVLIWVPVWVPVQVRVRVGVTTSQRGPGSPCPWCGSGSPCPGVGRGHHVPGVGRGHHVPVRVGVTMSLVWQQQSQREPGEQREQHIGRVLAQVAPSMMLCSLSEVICFLLGERHRDTGTWGFMGGAQGYRGAWRQGRVRDMGEHGGTGWVWGHRRTWGAQWSEGCHRAMGGTWGGLPSGRCTHGC